jgi:hypothetical protein
MMGENKILSTLWKAAEMSKPKFYKRSIQTLILSSKSALYCYGGHIEEDAVGTTYDMQGEDKFKSVNLMRKDHLK